MLLTAAARRCGIPARLGFADVRNHLTSEKLSAQMGTDLFAWHGYSELLIGDRWFKLSTAFNIELCDRFGVKTLDFDGTDDALMHPFDMAGNRHMEYVNQRGSFDDLPLDADPRRLRRDLRLDGGHPGVGMGQRRGRRGRARFAALSVDSVHAHGDVGCHPCSSQRPELHRRSPSRPMTSTGCWRRAGARRRRRTGRSGTSSSSPTATSCRG